MEKKASIIQSHHYFIENKWTALILSKDEVEEKYFGHIVCTSENEKPERKKGT